MKPFTYFLAGIIAGAGGGVGIAASAAPGDIIYETASVERVEISQAQAAAVAQKLIDIGAWDGSTADLIRGCAARDEASSTGFSAWARGFKSAAPGDVPVGAVVHGVEE
jgi:hypothetical protein